MATSRGRAHALGDDGRGARWAQALVWVQGFCLPGGPAGKESPCNVGDLGSIPGLGRSPGEGQGYPVQYPGGEFQGMYGPRAHKEPDTTERRSLTQVLCSGEEARPALGTLAAGQDAPRLGEVTHSVTRPSV